MAGLDPLPGAATNAKPNTVAGPSLGGFALSRRQFKTIAWLRWRLFVNALRGKGAVGELVVKFLSYPLLALMVLGPSVGSGFAAWYFVSHGQDTYLAIPLWIIFALWQFIGISTSASGPTFDLSILMRFPIRYRDYLLVRLSFGLLDPPTLAGIGCLFAMSIGIAIAAPKLLPWAALLLFLYAACNVLFSRMIYSWLERWLAQRRTRELLTGVILLLSLGFQFVTQFADKLGRHSHRAPQNSWLRKTEDIIEAINWYLPPGLTASSIAHMHAGMPLFALAALVGLAAFTAAFLVILNLRLQAEYRGENLSEAPASGPAKKSDQGRKPRPAAAQTKATLTSPGILPRGVHACLIKDIRYLLRSGPKLYALVMPVFMLFLISIRTSGMHQVGFSDANVGTYLFSYGCAYAQLIFVGLLYNSLGGDGAGVQFYFVAPVRLRDVLIAKNLMTSGILLIEVTLMYIVSVSINGRSSVAITFATLAWTLFAFLLSMSIGNIRSLTSPKGIESGKVRSQNVNGVSSLISLVVTVSCVALGVSLVFLCRWFHTGYWMAAAVFLVLAGCALANYLAVMRRIDSIALNHIESLTLELCKK